MYYKYLSDKSQAFLKITFTSFYSKFSIFTNYTNMVAADFVIASERSERGNLIEFNGIYTTAKAYDYPFSISKINGEKNAT